MQKGLSPIIASVLLIAFSLAIAALLGGWFTSLTKTETETIEESATTTVNCTKAVMDIISVSCNSTSNEFRLALNNLGSIELYDLSTYAKIGIEDYQNSTGGPNSTNVWGPGEQIILRYGCTGYCSQNATVGKVRVSAGSCGNVYIEEEAGVTCS